MWQLNTQATAHRLGSLRARPGRIPGRNLAADVTLSAYCKCCIDYSTQENLSSANETDSWHNAYIGDNQCIGAAPVGTYLCFLTLP